MEREAKKIHDDGSTTFEGDGFNEHYQHEWDHAKGRGDTDEHKGQWGHDELHNIPHNESPIKEDPVIKAYKQQEQGKKELERIKNIKSDPKWLEKGPHKEGEKK
jgi:hypothetical protein